MTSLSVAKNLLLVISTSLFFSNVNATTIDFLSDDFEQESLALNHNSFQNWVATDGTVDSIGPGLAGLNCQGSNVCVDLDGSSSNSAVFSTINEFDIGSYILKFDLSGSQRGGGDTVLVSLGDYSQSITMLGSAGWTTFQALVNVSQLSQLSFENQGGDNIGLVLDNVSVVRSVAAVNPVPVPSTVFLFGSVLCGLAVFRKKFLPKK